MAKSCRNSHASLQNSICIARLLSHDYVSYVPYVCVPKFITIAVSLAEKNELVIILQCTLK